ncbi:MAG: AMP-binding protein [Actinomycetota bacterium]|nr:AMP-binding protein [Actinomycetota bacterium]
MTSTDTPSTSAAPTARPAATPTTPALAVRALRRHPSRVAFEWDGGSMTYAEAEQTIARMQAVFASRGLGRGACLALLAGNRAGTWCATTAAQGLGMRTTALHPLGSLDDQRFQLADAGADALVVDVAAFGERGSHLADAVATTFTLDPADYGVDLTAAIAAVGPARHQDLARPEDVAVINYTGGTTGRSKGAMRRHSSLGPSTVAILSDFELPERPRFLAVAPISHVAGSKVLPTLVRGGTVYLQNGFDPERVIHLIDEARITMTLLVPTMIYTLLDHEALDRSAAGSGRALASLELLLYGASPMAPARLAEGLERIGPVFSQLYGQTECYPISVLAKEDHRTDRPDLYSSCGSPVASCEVTLLDPDGNEVPTGETGEICVRSPYVMDEYLDQPELTAQAFRHGWLHTDDVARQDEEGRLYIVDRAKDMVVSGGFNIYPREIEDVLTAHQAVAMAAVVGAPDDRWGEAVTAVVTLKPGADASREELASALKSLVRDAKGPAHTPKRVDFVDDLPVTAVGKIDKKAIRAPFWTGHTRQVG